MYVRYEADGGDQTLELRSGVGGIDISFTEHIAHVTDGKIYRNIYKARF